MRKISEAAERLLDEARKAGAEEADAIVAESSSISVDVRNGELEHAERSEGMEAGLRVIIGKKQACVASRDFRPEIFRDLAERAVAMAKVAPEDPSVGLASASQLAANPGFEQLELIDPAPEPDPSQLEGDALRAEASAGSVEGVTKVEAAAAGYGRSSVHVAASNGFSRGYERTSRNCACQAITGEGLSMETDYYGETRVFASDMSAPEEIGRIAGERTAARNGASKLGLTGAFPVLFDERVSHSLIHHLLSAINGIAIARGSSWLLDAMETSVLPSGLSLREEPRRPRATSSKPFDAEGLPTSEKPIVEQGVLKTWILDLATARKLRLESTANASRGPSGPPSPSVSNVVLSEGECSREQLLREMGSGLLITSMIGSSVNPTTGDYSRGASGFWVENGEIVRPVNELTIAGNLKRILHSIVPANDSREFAAFRVPSLLVEGLTVAGA
ncbi:MAG: TldD/PmbA family protein [Albidovulum sp.]|nr:TldD/PmbA family protein [Albidovulum sp.]